MSFNMWKLLQQLLNINSVFLLNCIRGTPLAEFSKKSIIAFHPNKIYLNAVFSFKKATRFSFLVSSKASVFFCYCSDAADV